MSRLDTLRFACAVAVLSFAQSAAGQGVLTLVQPSSGANLPVGAVTFQWQAVSGATSYQLRVCVSSGCSAGVLSTDTVATTSFQRSLNAGAYTYSVLAYQGSTLLAQSTDRPFWVDDFCAGQFAVGDFNGDGRADRLCSATGSTRVSLAAATGFAAPVVWLAQSFTKLLVGDFNGDGLVDIANFDNSVGGDFYVALSTGTAFGGPSFWGSATADGWPCRYINSVPGAADFNSDGKTDVYCQVSNGGTPDGRVIVGISTAGAFTFYTAGNSAVCGEYQSTGTFDFDGDGRPDYYCMNRDHNYPSVTVYPMVNGMLGTGIVAVTANFCGVDQYVFADVNGDGKTDITCPSSGQVALSTGNSYLHQGFFAQSCQGASTYAVQAFGADVDGDGRAEILCNNKKADATNITVRRWTGTALGPEQTWMSYFCSGTDANTGVITVADYNADGQADLLCNKVKAASAGRAAVRPDLMVTATNGLGGSTAVTYRPSSDYPTANAGRAGVRQVLSQVTRNDGRGNASTTSYSYAGGYVNNPERQFLGYSYVRETLPCLATEGTQCPYVETSLSQELASVGQPTGIYRYDGSGRLLGAVTNTYTNTTATPPRATLDRSDSYAYGASAADVLHTYTTYTYDNYGNALTVLAGGDVGASNDDLLTELQYAYNTSSYIVGRAGQVVRRAPGGSALTTEKYVYDGATDWATPPSKGDVTALKRTLTPPGREVARTMTYDAYGNVRSMTDETSRTVQTTYETTDTLFPAQVTNGASESVTYAWDPACGAVTSMTDPNSKTTTQSYDSLCRPLLTQMPLGAYEQKTYTWSGGLLTVRTDAPAGNGASGTSWAESSLDGFGRTWKTVSRGPASGQEIVSQRAYNPRGGTDWSDEPRYAGDAARTTHYEYDSLDRVTRVVMPGDREVTTSYGSTSVTTTDPDGKTTTTRVDGFGRTTSVERPFGATTATTSTTYDRLGRRVGMTDPLGVAWSWTYDSLGRVIAQNDPDAGNWTYVYDDAGRVTSQTDAKSQTTTMTYDTQVGRLASRTNTAGTVSYTYSQARGSYANKGRLTTLTSPADTLQIDYDSLGRVAKQDRLIGTTHYVVTKTYDAGGLVSIAYPDGDTVGPMQYDGAGRLSSISGILTSVVYDALGRPTSQTNGNGTQTSWSYLDPRGFLSRIQTTGSAGTIQDLQYTQYKDSGLLEQVTSPTGGEGWSYAYDDLNHLVTATNLTNGADSQSYTYDAGDRILTSSRYGSYTYPAASSPRPHGPTAVGGTALSYDANGNTLTAGTRGLTWNADNRLSQTTLGGVTTSFSYGGDGERLGKTSSLGTSLYPFGDDYEITGGVTTKYVTVAGLGVVAKRVGTGGNAVTYWLHADRLGSIQAVTNTAGAIVFRRQYRPYGETLAQSGSHTESRGWIDQRNDGESGLTYLHARYHDPQLGVFVSPDPIGVEGGMNQYMYAAGDPVNGTDRAGLYWHCATSNDHQRQAPDGSWEKVGNEKTECYWIPDPTPSVPGKNPQLPNSREPRNPRGPRGPQDPRDPKDPRDPRGPDEGCQAGNASCAKPRGPLAPKPVDWWVEYFKALPRSVCPGFGGRYTEDVKMTAGFARSTAGTAARSAVGVVVGIRVSQALGSPGPMGAFYSGMRSTVFGPATNPASLGVAAGFADAVAAAVAPQALGTLAAGSFATAGTLLGGVALGTAVEAGWATCS